MGHRIHPHIRNHIPSLPDLHFCALSGWLPASGDSGVFPCGKAIRTGDRGFTRTEETTGIIHAGRGEGELRVWVLFRCRSADLGIRENWALLRGVTGSDQGVFPVLGVDVCFAIFIVAVDIETVLVSARIFNLLVRRG